MLKRYRTRFKEQRTKHDLKYIKEALKRSFSRITISPQPQRYQYASGLIVERYSARLDGRKAGLDFIESTGEFVQITMSGKKLPRPLFEKVYGKNQTLLEASLAGMFSKKPDPKPVAKPAQDVNPSPMIPARGTSAKSASKVSFPSAAMQAAEPESQEVHMDAPKEIFSGTQIFQKAERRLRMFLAKASKKNIFCLVGPGGTGKAQFYDTPTLTPNGWVPMGTLKEGDLVIGSHGKPVRVIGVFPQGKKEVFRVEINDNKWEEVECCDEHLWTVIDNQHQKSKVEKVLPLKEIVKNASVYKRGWKLNRYQLPVVSPVCFEENIPEEKRVDPYLLGVLIGDGSLRNGIGFTCFDPPIVEKIRHIITSSYLPEDVSLKTNSEDGRNYYALTRETFSQRENPLLTKMRNLGLIGKLSYDKFIPAEYLFGSIETRIELLRGLMDTDGTIGITTRGLSLCYNTSSEKLHKDFMELIYGLGGHCTLSTKYPTYVGADGEKLRSEHLHYSVNFNIPKHINPFYLPRKAEMYSANIHIKKEPWRKITNIYSTGTFKEALCIRVDSPDSLYVTKNYVLTHNTVAAYNALNKTCGAQLTSADIYKNLKDASFDKEEFRIRIEAKEAIDKAKDFFRRYLNSAKLNRSAGEQSSMFIDDEHLEAQALQKAQEAIGDELYGYKLTLDDMKGGGNIARTGSDPIMKLKQLGSQEASVPYDPSNGWTKGSVRTSADKEIYLMLYSANARALFVDEGDDLLTKGSTIIKEAFDAVPARHVTSGSNKGYLEVGNFVLPEDFWYTGKMVVNTNVPPSQWNQAVRTRADVFPLYLSVNQLLDRLVEILPSMHKAELSHYPMAIMGIVIRFLKKAEKGIERWGRSGKFLSRTQLTQFDYRTFVQMCVELALLIQDEIEEAQASPREGEDTSFTVEGASNSEFEQWTKTGGKSIYTRALNKWKKSALMDIELMNKADGNNQNVIPLQSEEEV